MRVAVVSPTSASFHFFFSAMLLSLEKENLSKTFENEENNTIQFTFLYLGLILQYIIQFKAI